MSQTTSARRPRPRGAAARTFVFVGAVVAVVGVAGACSEARRANGDSCTKDEDCLSSICAGGACIASGPMLDAAYDADTGTTKPDASEAGPDSVAAMDTSTPPKEAAAEATSEASPDAGETGSSESGSDGSGDGAGD
jgi:hypothetical protein